MKVCGDVIQEAGEKWKIEETILDRWMRRRPAAHRPGRVRTATATWETELLRVIELDPHEVGQDTANWTTELLAEYLDPYPQYRFRLPHYGLEKLTASWRLAPPIA